MTRDTAILGAPFDPQLIAAIEALSPEARITSIDALTGGVSAQVHSVRLTRGDTHGDADVHEVVVRRRADSAAWGKRLPMEMEYKLLQRLHQAGLSVPQPRLWWPPDTLVMDFVHGTTELPIDAEVQMALALARIHAQTISCVEGMPDREDPVSQLNLLLPQASIADYIEVFSAAPHDTCLLHGDFWSANLLWQKDQLAAIIDWEDAAVGDPLSDLSCARLELSIARGEASSRVFTAHYLSATKRDATRLALWDLYVATTALDSMDQWGLHPNLLPQRRTATQTFQNQAVAALGELAV